MPDERLEFSAQDLGRLAAHVALSREAPIVAARDWLARYVTNDSQYKRVLGAYLDGLGEYMEQELATP